MSEERSLHERFCFELRNVEETGKSGAEVPVLNRGLLACNRPVPLQSPETLKIRKMPF